MEIKEFRQRVKPGKKLLIDSKELDVLEVVKYAFDDGGYYIKCYLSDGYVIAEDSEMDVYILVRQIHPDFQEPFKKIIEYDEKRFKFLYFAHTTAEEVWGKGRAKKGSGEKFWDYMAEDGSYLSLGISDASNERLDFYGRTFKPSDLEMK